MEKISFYRWIVRILILAAGFAFCMALAGLCDWLLPKVGLIATMVILVILVAVIVFAGSKVLMVYDPRQDKTKPAEDTAADELANVYQFADWDTAHAFIKRAREVCKNHDLTCITYAVPIGECVVVTVHTRNNKSVRSR